MAQPDDERLGQLLRALRRRNRMTQRRLAEAAGIPVDDVIDIEAGRVGRVRVERIQSALGVCEARLRLGTWWHGASADRLIDEAHAAIVEAVAGVFVRARWRTAPETSFSEFGERGSVDLMAANEAARAVAICEIKSAFGSLEETNRTLDAKVRLAPVIARRVFGFEPRFVGRILVVADTATARRIVRRHEATMEAIYPVRSRAIREWIRHPSGAIAGIWFLSILGDSERRSP